MFVVPTVVVSLNFFSSPSSLALFIFSSVKMISNSTSSTSPCTL
uniref:Uncharacterized protein n=1 Tax=Arundo donax TaxID=35708 RepID=A0A0A9G9B3_ARUDO